jgi:hypothetical protein
VRSLTGEWDFPCRRTVADTHMGVNPSSECALRRDERGALASALAVSRR